MKLGLLIGFCVLCMGCATQDYYRLFNVANRSQTDINFVVIGTSELENSFGYLGSGGSGKGSSGCLIQMTPEYRVKWKENGLLKESPIDLAPYLGKMDEIKSFSFFYLGNGKWQITARRGNYEDSAIVSPE